MSCLCTGTIFNVLLHISKDKQTSVYERLAYPLREDDFGTANDSSVTGFKKGAKGFPKTYLRDFTFENLSKITASYRRNFPFLLKSGEEKIAFLGLRHVILDDPSIGENSKIGDGRLTKSILREIKVVDFDSLIACCMVYVAGIDNDHKEKEVSELDATFWKRCEEESSKSGIDIKNEPVPVENELSDTLLSKKEFQRTFYEVPLDQNVFPNGRESQLKIYHLNVTGAEFAMQPVVNFIYHNLGRYVFSRTKRKDYEGKGLIEILGSDAIRVLARNYSDDSYKTAFTEIMLYSFVEAVMEGKKVLSAVELKSASSFTSSKSQGIYLIPAGSVSDRNQIVFGCTDAFTDLETAFSAVVDRGAEIAHNMGDEYLFLESGALKEPVSDDEWAYLERVLRPGEADTPRENAFGVFVAYTIRIPGRERMSNPEFIEALAAQMRNDIAANAPKLIEKIETAGLNGYPFYIFVLPLLDVDKDSTGIMKRALGVN